MPVPCLGNFDSCYRGSFRGCERGSFRSADRGSFNGADRGNIYVPYRGNFHRGYRGSFSEGIGSRPRGDRNGFRGNFRADIARFIRISDRGREGFRGRGISNQAAPLRCRGRGGIEEGFGFRRSYDRPVGGSGVLFSGRRDEQGGHGYFDSGHEATRIQMPLNATAELYLHGCAPPEENSSDYFYACIDGGAGYGCRSYGAFNPADMYGKNSYNSHKPGKFHMVFN